MAFYTYILKCADDSYYVGHTDDMDRRLAEHDACVFPGYTAKRWPVKLVYSCESPSRDDAFRIEQQIKGWTRKKKEALIRGDWAQLQQLARSHTPKTPASER